MFCTICSGFRHHSVYSSFETAKTTWHKTWQRNRRCQQRSTNWQKKAINFGRVKFLLTEKTLTANNSSFRKYASFYTWLLYYYAPVYCNLAVTLKSPAPQSARYERRITHNAVLHGRFSQFTPGSIIPLHPPTAAVPSSKTPPTHSHSSLWGHLISFTRPCRLSFQKALVIILF